jgi:hypothetical protein
MNCYLVTYAINFVKNNDDSFVDDIAYVRFFDTGTFPNSINFLSSLKQTTKLRITGVDWEYEVVNFDDEIDCEISNTYH